jgi:hypothetical protein
MTSSDRCEQGLLLQWLQVNEIAIWEAGVAINCQPLVT